MAIGPGDYYEERSGMCHPGECRTCDERRYYRREDRKMTADMAYYKTPMAIWDINQMRYIINKPRQYGKSLTMQGMMETVQKVVNNNLGEDMYDSSNSVNDTKLIKNLKKLSMDDETQLLLDAKVVDDKGNLTREGFAFVLTVLFDENRSLVVSKLKAIKQLEAKSKAAPAAEYEKALEAGKAAA